MAVIKGEQQIVIGPVTSTWDSKNGGTTTKTFTCASIEPIISYAQSLITFGWSTVIDQTGKGGVCTLKATYNADLLTDPSEARIPEISWEVEPNIIQQNILEATDRNLVKSLSTDTKRRIEGKIKFPEKDKPLVSSSETAQAENANIVYQLIFAGTHRYGTTISIKRSLIVNPRYTDTWPSDNNSRVFTKDLLINTYNVPLWVQGWMPNTFGIEQESISKIVTFRGYLEYAPTVQSVSHNRIKLSQKWDYQKWPVGDKGLYDTIGI